MSLRFLPLLAAAIAACIATTAIAQPVRPFTLAALHDAQAKGEPVLVDAFAPWCPVCRAQAPTIDALAQDPAFTRLVIFRLDYDSQVAEKKSLGISRQSTLITYKGDREVARVVGISNPGQIKAFASAPLQ